MFKECVEQFLVKKIIKGWVKIYFPKLEKQKNEKWVTAGVLVYCNNIDKLPTVYVDVLCL